MYPATTRLVHVFLGLAPVRIRHLIDVLLFATLFEVFIGGGGRFVSIGPISLRMLLFIACVSISVMAALLRWRQDGGQMVAYGLVLAYLLIHVLGITIGAMRGAEPGAIFTEFQGTLYWLAAPFFAMELQTSVMVRRASVLIQSAGILLAVSYVLLLVGIAVGEINLGAVLSAVADNDDFGSRGYGLLFYKSFLYVGLAIVFVVAKRSRCWLPLAILMGMALVLTLTRGFILSTATAVLLMLVIQGRKISIVLGLAAILGAVFIAWSYIPSIDDSFVSARETSNSQRLDDMSFMLNHASVGTLVFGEGFGSPINGRSNIENTYLWALWRMGIAGVLFWLTPLALCAYYYFKSRKGNSDGLASAYFFGAVLVYVQTATNPYLNNTIGLTFVLLAIFSLRTLAKGTASQIGLISASCGLGETQLLPQ